MFLSIVPSREIPGDSYFCLVIFKKISKSGYRLGFRRPSLFTREQDSSGRNKPRPRRRNFFAREQGSSCANKTCSLANPERTNRTLDVSVGWPSMPSGEVYEEVC